MTDYIVQGESLENIAEVIREKTGGDSPLEFPADFINGIDGLVDTSDATATGMDILEGKTAYVDGELIHGGIPSKTSADLTASGDTVIVPAGYYDETASKSVDPGSVVIPDDAIAATPSISVSAGGLISALVNTSKTIIPTVMPGYVSSVVSVIKAVIGSATKQLTTQAAQTITPTTTDQTITAGKYLTGDQTIKGDANLIADNIKNGVEIFGKIGTYLGSSTPETPTDALLFYSPNEIELKTNNGLKNWGGTLYYSTDHTNWTEWSGTTQIFSALSDGYHKIYLRGTGNTTVNNTGSSNAGRWVLFGANIKCVGNCNNLLDYTQTITNVGSSAFLGLFNRVANVDFDIELPATTIGSNSYSYMFYGCSSLINPPKLPATTISGGCYAYMFYDCISLKTIPELPATTLATQCYKSMFGNCSSIKLSAEQTGEYQTPYRIPTNGTGTDATNALEDMFTNIGGTFTGTPTINTNYYTSNTVIPAV